MPAIKADSAALLEIAAFDFDGTLTRSDSLLPFLRRSLGWPGFLRALLRASPWLAAYACGLLGNQSAKAKLLQLSLGGRSLAEIERWSADFVSHYLPLQWQPDIMARLRQHQQSGHCCVIVSASPGIYLHSVGELLGLDAVICTELEVQAGALTGRMATPNCYGEEKVRRLQVWLAEQGEQRPMVLHAYGDSRGDVPLLNLADYAWYKGQPRARKTAANQP